MRREILWYQSALETFFHLTVRDARQANRVMLAVRQYGSEGRGDIKKLQGLVQWRLRSGDWRIFLKLDGPVAYVVGLSDRQDAY